MFNNDKTKVQFYGCYNSISNDKYFVKVKNGEISNDIKIEVVKEMTNMGIIINSHYEMKKREIIY